MTSEDKACKQWVMHFRHWREAGPVMCDPYIQIIYTMYTIYYPMIIPCLETNNATLVRVLEHNFLQTTDALHPSPMQIRCGAVESTWRADLSPQNNSATVLTTRSLTTACSEPSALSSQRAVVRRIVKRVRHSSTPTRLLQLLRDRYS